MPSETALDSTRQQYRPPKKTSAKNTSRTT